MYNIFNILLYPIFNRYLTIHHHFLYILSSTTPLFAILYLFYLLFLYVVSKYIDLLIRFFLLSFYFLYSVVFSIFFISNNCQLFFCLFLVCYLLKLNQFLSNFFLFFFLCLNFTNIQKMDF